MPGPVPASRSWYAWTGFLRRFRGPVAILLALGIGLAAWTAREIRTEHNPLTLFASGDPEIAWLEDFWATFGNDVNFLMVLVEPPDRDPLSAAALAVIRDLSEQLAAAPNVIEVQSPAWGETTVFADGELRREAWLSPGPVTAGSATRVRGIIEASPLWRNLFMGELGEVAAIFVRYDPDRLDADVMGPALDEVDRIVGAVMDGYRVEIIGVPYTERAYIRGIQDDQRLFMPVVLGVLFLMMAWLFRSPGGALLPLVSVGSAVAVLVAVMVVVDVPFDVVSFTIPTLILVIGVADSIHMLERFLEERRAGRSPREAIDTSTMAIGAACLLTSATTAVGFGSLMTAEVDIIQRFGFWAAVGVGIAWGCTVTIVPLWLTFRPIPVRGHEGGEGGDRVDRALKALAVLPNQYPNATIGFWSLLAVLAIWGTMSVRQDSRLLEELFDDDPVSIAQHWAEDRGFAILPVAVDFSGEPGVFRDPAVLADLDDFARWLRTQAIVGRTGSLADLAAELHRLLEGEAGLYDDPAALAQALFLVESGDDPDVLWSWVTPDFGRSQVQIMRYDHGMVAYEHFERDMRRELEARFGPDHPLEWHITGSTIMAVRAVRNIVNDLLASLGTAFVIIAILMAFLFRSIRIGLISLVPNVLPLLFAAAVMGVAGYNIRISSGIIFSVALGIAVDDAIHFLARYRLERQAGVAQDLAVERTLRTAGRAMLWTTVLLVAGFAVLASSGFRGIVEFGLLMAVVLASALAVDLTLLPALLRKARPFGATAEAARREAGIDD